MAIGAATCIKVRAYHLRPVVYCALPSSRSAINIQAFLSAAADPSTCAKFKPQPHPLSSCNIPLTTFHFPMSFVTQLLTHCCGMHAQTQAHITVGRSSNPWLVVYCAIPSRPYGSLLRLLGSSCAALLPICRGGSRRASPILPWQGGRAQ